MQAIIGEYLDLFAATIKSRVARAAGFVIFGNIGSGVLRFAVTMLLAAVLTEADMGYLGIFIALMDMVAVISESGLNNTMVRFMAAQAKRRPQALILKCFFIKLSFVALCALVLALTANVYFRTQDIPEMLHWLYPAAIASGMVLSFNMFGVAIAQGRQHYGLYSVLALTINGLRLAAVGLMVLLKVRNESAYLAVFFGMPAVALLLTLTAVTPILPWRKDGPVSARPAADASATTRELLYFMAPLALTQVLAIMILRLDVMMLKSMSDVREVGNYFVANQIAFVFPLLGQALVTVLLPKVSAMTSARELKRYRRLAFQCYPPTLLVTAVAALAAPLVLTLLFKDKYQSASLILRLLIISYGIGMIVNPLCLVFYAVGRTYYIPLIHAVQLLVFFLCNLLLIPRYAGVGAAMTGIIIRLAVAFVVVFATREIKKKELSEAQAGCNEPV